MGFAAIERQVASRHQFRERELRARLRARSQRGEPVNLETKRAGDAARGLICDHGRVAALAAQAVGPDIRPGRRVHQVEVDFQVAVGSVDVADDGVLHAEVGHQVGVGAAVAIGVRCRLRDHPQIAEAAEVADKTVGEVAGECRVIDTVEPSAAKGRTTTLWL